jgi:hypothetical protein
MNVLLSGIFSQRDRLDVVGVIPTVIFLSVNGQAQTRLALQPRIVGLYRKFNILLKGQAEFVATLLGASAQISKAVFQRIFFFPACLFALYAERRMCFFLVHRPMTVRRQAVVQPGVHHRIFRAAKILPIFFSSVSHLNSNQFVTDDCETQFQTQHR